MILLVSVFIVSWPEDVKRGDMRVYVIRMNSDMTEGTGSMRLVDIMLNKNDAINFAMAQPGVMGVLHRQSMAHERFELFAFDWRTPTRTGIKLVEGDWEVIEFEI